jgi:hypothetical protein
MTTRYGHLRTADLHSELEKVAQFRSQEHLTESRDQSRADDPEGAR